MERKQNELYQVSVEELIIKNGDKDVYGKIYKPKGEGKYPAIILSHGYNGCNTDFVNECKYYAENRVIAYAYDFCGGSTESKSSGSSVDMTIFTEKEDLVAVFNYIRKLDDVDTDNIFLFGGSQGGLVTTLAAEECRDLVKGMILYYPALNIPDDWRKKYTSDVVVPDEFEFWGLQLGGGFVKAISDFYTFDNIGKFDKKVFIIHGDKDDIVPLAYSEKAIEHYPDANLYVMNGEGHGFMPEAGKKAMELVLGHIKNLIM